MYLGGPRCQRNFDKQWCEVVERTRGAVRYIFRHSSTLVSLFFRRRFVHSQKKAVLRPHCPEGKPYPR